jgi:putative Holliday junction resolvase
VTSGRQSKTAANFTRGALVFDFGKRRIGVAFANLQLESAAPIRTLAARDGQPDWHELDELMDEWQPGILVVGLPYNMDGSESPVTVCAREFGKCLAGRYHLPVDTLDERLTSAEAGMLLRDQRHRGLRRRRVRREDVDSLAAQLIAESWLRHGGSQR